MANEKPEVDAPAAKEAAPTAGTAGVSKIPVGGGILAGERPKQPGFSITPFEFGILKKGSDQSFEHNLGFAFLGIAVGTMVSILLSIPSLSFEDAAGKPKWTALVLFGVAVIVGVVSTFVTVFCFLRARMNRENDSYKQLVNTIESDLGR